MVELSVVSNLLQQLLSIHNRVSLPGLGAFKVDHTPATFVDGGKKMIPPSKYIYFSSAEIWNDNLLENALSQEEGCSIEEAKEQMATFGMQIKQALAKGQRIAFAGLGVLRLTDDQEYRFDADSNQQLTPGSYGLLEIEMVPRPTIAETPPVQAAPPVETTPTVETPPPVETIPPVEIASPEEVTPPVQAPPAPPIIINRTIVREEPKKRSYTLVWILAAVVVIAACGYIFRKPIRDIIEKTYYGEYYDIFLRDYKDKK